MWRVVCNINVFFFIPNVNIMFTISQASFDIVKITIIFSVTMTGHVYKRSEINSTTGVRDHINEEFKATVTCSESV